MVQVKRNNQASATADLQIKGFGVRIPAGALWQ
jgi:hypothetical protein